MSTFILANNATSVLAAPISSTATTCTLVSGSGSLFPNPGAGEHFVMTFQDAATKLTNEIVWCTSRSGDTLTIARNQEGTTSPTNGWAAGDIASNFWTAGQAMSLLQEGASPLGNIAVYAIVGGVQQVSINGSVFSSLGASLFTWPSSGSAYVSATGGGASGGSTGTTAGRAAGGGGSGGTAEGLITGQTPGGTVTITVGAGAAVTPAGTGTDGNAGSNGGDTTFGSLLTGGGGLAGNGATSSNPTPGGRGGAATGGTINSNGGAGGDGYGIGGNGGNGIFGGAGRASTTVNTIANGAAPGAAGGGAYYGAGIPGGSGDPGILIVRY